MLLSLGSSSLLHFIMKALNVKSESLGTRQILCGSSKNIEIQELGII